MIADLQRVSASSTSSARATSRDLALRQEFRVRAQQDSISSRSGPLGNVTVIPGNPDAYVAEGVPLFGEDLRAVRDDGRRLGVAAAVTSPTAQRTTSTGHDRLRPHADLALLNACRRHARTPWFTAFWPRRRRPARPPRVRALADDPRLARQESASSRSITRLPAAVALSRIRGLRDHDSFAAVIAAHGADLIVHDAAPVCCNMTESLAGPTMPTPRSRCGRWSRRIPA